MIINRWTKPIGLPLAHVHGVIKILFMPIKIESGLLLWAIPTYTIYQFYDIHVWHNQSVEIGNKLACMCLNHCPRASQIAMPINCAYLSAHVHNWPSRDLNIAGLIISLHCAD